MDHFNMAITVERQMICMLLSSIFPNSNVVQALLLGTVKRVQGYIPYTYHEDFKDMERHLVSCIQIRFGNLMEIG
ncbi:hypothetical protein QJS10_CPB18g00771 [Acorus calamus]|uniref:Uncharacterized protein n=1 Tax=Acorus calamus TaxID=4465 RepID=A0AAV9CM96_ACOCL|nr:hypothetical protein QJS10_CPB18g00771 [Acorus calamus]